MEILPPNIEVDIHLLDLRYEHTRIKDAKSLRRLQASISSYGQIVPALVVAEDDKFILIDGYLRLKALKGCGHDCIYVQVLEDAEVNALFTLLAQDNAHHYEAIEQASLINELHSRFSCSFAEIGKRLGRDKSWVKRRLDLITSLPDTIQQAVMNGKVSTWAASHVLVPLSRVNAKDACQLTENISKDPISTRELNALYKHYQKSTRKVRDRIITQPALFAKTIKQQALEREAKQIADGPEGKWQRDITVVCHILKRLLNTAEYVFYPSIDEFQYRQHCIWIKNAEKTLMELKERARRSHDTPDIPPDNFRDESEESRYA